MLPIYFYFLFFSCQIGNQNNVQVGTKKQTSIQHLEKIATLSQQLEEAAFDLESAIDESRRAIKNGSTPTEENKKLEEYILELDKRNTSLQQEVKDLENQLYISNTPTAPE